MSAQATALALCMTELERDVHGSGHSKDGWGELGSVDTSELALIWPWTAMIIIGSLQL